MCILCALQAAALMQQIDRLMTAAEVATIMAEGLNERTPEERNRIIADMLQAHNPRGRTVEQMVRRFQSSQENDYQPTKVIDGKVYYFNPVTTDDDSNPWALLPLPNDEMHADIAGELVKLRGKGERKAQQTVSSFMERMSKATH